MEEKKQRKEPFGRPTKYKENYPEVLVDWFERPDFEYEDQEVASAGVVKTIRVKVPTKFPSVEGFCRHLKISKVTFHKWVKKYPLFMNALSKCKAIQQDHLVNHALNGTFHAGFAKFLMINLTEYKDKVETVNENKEIKVVLPDERATKL